MHRFRTPASARSAQLIDRLTAIVAASTALGLVVAFSAAQAAGAPARGSAFADTTRPVTFLKETVVTGARYPRAYFESPQALSFVTRAQIRDAAPTVIGDMLTNLPGVDNSKDSPWEQRPVIRGLTGQRVLVMMDGFPMNSARGNGPHPSLVDASQVERVEVVRGPSSVAYGSDALGGAINIITRQAPPSDGTTALRGAATLGGSSAEKERTGFLELMPRVGKLSAYLSSGGRKAEDYRSANGTVPLSGFSDYNALANVRYDLTEQTALKAGYQLYRAKDIGIPGLLFDIPGFHQDFDFSFYDRDEAHVDLEHKTPASWLAATQLRAYWQRESRDFFSNEIDGTAFLPPGYPPGTDHRVQLQDRYFKLGTYGVQLQGTSRRTTHTQLVGGIDVARDHTDGDNVRHRTYEDASNQPLAPTSVLVTASVPDGNFDNLAAFAQSEWFAGPQWTFDVGGRFTHYHYRTDVGVNSASANFPAYKLDNDAGSGSFGVVYTPIADLHVTANVANGYRQPNAQDLFFNGPASVGTVIGNQALKPEKSVSGDFGLRWGPGDLAFAGNLFYSTYNDLIDAVQVAAPPAPGAPSTYQYVNISEATIWGGEAEAEVHFHEQWTARATCTGTVGDITKSAVIATASGPQTIAEGPLPNVPPFKGTFALRWTNKTGRYWLEPSTRYSWRTNRLPVPTPGVPQIGAFKAEWIVGDVFAGARLGTGQRLVLGVRNFTDTPYRQALASVDDPGISLVGSLSTDF
ncbi:MAG TPA: TonB-dependent receptor [Candidatus Saccharimonadaceae bacterium]|jgi:outer membrane receptor protein involved in Fe transport|nr:TonB-dependent receptor [Candidatus Saccharimonadaceae bacterium]